MYMHNSPVNFIVIIITHCQRNYNNIDPPAFPYRSPVRTTTTQLFPSSIDCIVHVRRPSSIQRFVFFFFFYLFQLYRYPTILLRLSANALRVRTNNRLTLLLPDYEIGVHLTRGAAIVVPIVQ